MNLDELFNHLVTFAISDVNALEVIHELKETPRYHEEADFRVMVDYAQLLNDGINSFGVKEKFAKRIISCIDIIDRATKLKLWSLSSNAWNSLAVTYQTKLMYERALECYSHALRIESQHGNYKISPLVYTNIVSIFMQIGEYDKALNFIQSAQKILENHKDSIPRYLMRYVSVCLWHIRIRIAKKLIDKNVLRYYLERIESVDPKDLSYEIKGMVLTAKFYYGFFFYEKEEFEEVLEQIKTDFGLPEYILYLQQCIELSKAHGRDYEQYAQKLMQIEVDEEGLHPIVNLYNFEVRMQYYEKHGDLEKLEETRIKYIKTSNEYLEILSEQQGQAINTIEQLLMSEEFKKKNEIENIEFKKIAEEAIKTKKELEKAYKRIEIIGELGRRITATTDLDELVDMIYQMTKEHLSVDLFTLLYTDEENKVLRSAAVYQKDVLQSKFEVSLSDKHNISVQCYDSKCILQYVGCMNMADPQDFECDCEEFPKSSCILIPLIVADKVIGVLSLQSENEGAYEGENLRFLKEIEPYLSIALNNGVKSRMMEKESENRRRIRLELEEANAVLSKLSSMDGLTQIGSRRDFEDKFTQMLRIAKEQDYSVSVFMMDIDYFKYYNDNYGHLQGDEVLKQVAKVFREHLNPIEGLSARFGGEEFIGAALKLTKEKALQLARTICDEIRGLKIEHRSSPLNILTVSIGVAVCEAPDEPMRSELMRVADECLYLAKAEGKNASVLGQVDKN